MHVLVCSRVSIPDKDRTLPAWEYLRKRGHRVTVEHPDSVPTDDRPDALISMGVTIMDETFRALERFPGAPLFAYNWDCYEWVWEPCPTCGGRGTCCSACRGSGRDTTRQAYHPMRGKEYDYVRYGDLLLRAAEVWVPSACTGTRTTQWWGIPPERIATVLSACPWWDHPCKRCEGDGKAHGSDRPFEWSGPGTYPGECPVCKGSGSGVRDGGYALCTLRHLPDPWDTVFEECCQEIGIPFRRTDHDLSHEDYRDAVAGCRFLVSHYHELSTGGLTLMEGYRIGKPCLLSDSPWHGGRDYMGNRAFYFRDGDREHFKSQLHHLYHGRVAVEPDHKEWVERNFNDFVMVDRMVERIGRVLASAGTGGGS